MGVSLVLISFVLVFLALFSAFKWAQSKIRQKKIMESAAAQELPLERSIGGPVERELPVLQVDRDALSPTQRSAAIELTGLYGWLRTHGRQLSPSAWRELAQSTLDAVSHYESTGDPGLMDHAARRLGSLLKME